jgi:hypothetical protein
MYRDCSAGFEVKAGLLVSWIILEARLVEKKAKTIGYMKSDEVLFEDIKLARSSSKSSKS